MQGTNHPAVSERPATGTAASVPVSVNVRVRAKGQDITSDGFDAAT